MADTKAATAQLFDELDKCVEKFDEDDEAVNKITQICDKSEIYFLACKLLVHSHRINTS
jgi:hypothetical protein